jgi:hypothetical protein
VAGLIVLDAFDEDAVIDGGIRIDLHAGRNVVDEFQEIAEAREACIRLAGFNGFCRDGKSLAVILARIAFVNRQQREKFFVAGKWRLEFFDFGGGIGTGDDSGLQKFGHAGGAVVDR